MSFFFQSNSISENRSYVDSKNQKNLQSSKQNDLRNINGPPRLGSDGSDIEEDPFFDDAIPSNKSYNKR